MPTPALPSVQVLPQGLATIMKEQAEALVSTEEVAVRALEALGPNALPKEVVESEGLIAFIAAASNIGPLDPSPSVPWVTVVPDTRGD